MAAEAEIQEFFEKAGAAAGAAYNAVTRDGTIDAFLRQGVGELGNALVAFPNGSIQHDEPGAVFNPLYSDIAADKREANLPTPADLTESPAAAAEQQGQQPTQGHGISM